jgi:hypothetical protein
MYVVNLLQERFAVMFALLKNSVSITACSCYLL